MLQKETVERILNTKLFLFDMDGTLYLGNRLFPFTKELLATIRKSGRSYMFMTNNSSKSVVDYIEKLKKLGIYSEAEDFITSAQATVHYLKSTCPDERIYVEGTESLRQEMKKAGFAVIQEIDKVDCIVMGFDTELTFQKLEDVCKILSTRDVRYIATHPDTVCPTEYGSVPDCGAVCEMVFHATGKRPLVIGKPEALMPQMAMRQKGVFPTQTTVVGDRIYTDVKCGNNAGTLSVLVLSGETDEKILAASDVKPGLVLKDCGVILEALKETV